ncbi:MAG: glycoside hydrolase family 127 protein [Lachnospiraceae bacterium]|nr:glycoside hydrolase family 127 protein [Lachnospiraceae bacterium]
MEDILKRFQVSDGFFGQYQKLVLNTVIPYQEKVLKDEIPDAEKSHAIENFKLAAGEAEGEFYGFVFQDSDVAKWLEAASYGLAVRPDEEMEKHVDEVIALVGRAQQPNGYLDTYFTVKEPDKKWTNLGDWHELYCAGHMIEAGVANYQATKKTALLSIVTKLADHICDTFGEGKRRGVPGHPEVELALVRLYQATGNKKYLNMAKYFIDTRGTEPEYFTEEAKKQGDTSRGWKDRLDYAQAYAPLREQKEARGHAVRAVYLYSGMASVAKETNDVSLITACKNLWENITERKMYVTGAIGSAYEGEAFTKDFHLPNDTAYAETCASVGLIFFARRMLELEKDSKYADTMERALYNCVLAGMQLDGTRFFYVNPLEVVPGISGEAITHRHALPKRPKWFPCACCPPNVARLVASIAKYAWEEEQSTVYSHLFLDGTLTLGGDVKGKIKEETAYPYGNTVTYHFEPEEEYMELTLAVRLPYWSENTKITVNGEDAKAECRQGYAYITRKFSDKDFVTVTFDMEAKRIFAAEQVAADSGKIAFQRGPLVYCAEGVDNDGDVLGLRVKKDGVITVTDSNEFGGIKKIEVEGERVQSENSLYSIKRPGTSAVTITLVPYYVWGNRGENQMRVWMPEV